MSLGKMIKQNPPLLDILYELNDLVIALSGKEFQETILELQKETDLLEAAKDESIKAKKENDDAIAKLNKSIDDNNKFIISARKEREALEQSKIDISNQLQKLNSSKNAAESAHKLLEAKSIEVNNDHLKKTQIVSEKEKRANEAQKMADAIKTEYETKLAHIKKIAG